MTVEGSPTAAPPFPESRSATSTLRGAVQAALLGACFGAATSVSNAMVSPSEPESFARIVSFVLDAGWAWAALAVAAGWIARTPRSGAVAGVVALLTATTAYFTVDSIHRDEPFGSYSAELLRWWLVSVSLGWVLGVIGASARRKDAVGLAAALVVPLGAFAQMIVLPPGPGGPGTTAAMTSARVLVITAAVLAAAAAVIRFVRHRRDRPADAFP
jgi:hypothetical protein